MKFLRIVLLTSLLFGTPIAAQSDCGSGLPCGSIPWRLPALPDLSSPTPMPTLELPESSANPGEPTNTPAPPATMTPLPLDTSGIQDQIDALNSLFYLTPVPVDYSGNLGINLEAGELIINGDFGAWSSTYEPTGWTLASSLPPDKTVTQNPGGGALFHNVPSTATLRVTQYPLVIGKTYDITIVVASVTGSMVVSDNSTVIFNITTPGTKYKQHTAANTQVSLRPGTASDVVLTSVSVREANAQTVLNDISTNAGIFFGYARGINGENFGPLAPLVSLSLISLVLILSVKLTTFLLPVLAALVGILRKLLVAILEFLPL